MQSNITGASYGQKRRFGGMTKLLNPRPFAVPTMREASMPMTMTSPAMTMANSNTTTNMANATSMVLSYSSATTITTGVADDTMTENLNTNTTTTTTMASVKSMMMNSTRLLMANDTTVSTLASSTAAAAYTSVNTTKATKPKSAATTATKQKSTATKATKLRSAASKATKPKSVATLKRKYDDLEDDSGDDGDPPPSKKRKYGRRSHEDSIVSIKKKIRTELLQSERMLLFKGVLLTKGAFGPEQWRQLYDQLGDEDKYVRELFFSEQYKKWRTDFLSAARDVVAPYRLGRVSSMVANSALERGRTATFTSTLRFVVDDKANDVAIGNLVMTLEKYRNGNVGFVPPPDVAFCFAKGNWDKAKRLARLEHDSILEHAAESYAYENANELAAHLKDKYQLSQPFPLSRKKAMKHLSLSPERK